MPAPARLAVIALARLAYFWAFVAVFTAFLALAFQMPWLMSYVPRAFGQWEWWCAVAVAVGRFPLLDDFLDERL
ncbi:hypothetical protein [Phenylobacterium sp.]|uniref:hypothetical protein n=1 Tax=Phenylobacterium sp. TaxID=1871053 RepID=UPI0039300474